MVSAETGGNLRINRRAVKTLGNLSKICAVSVALTRLVGAESLQTALPLAGFRDFTEAGHGVSPFSVGLGRLREPEGSGL